MSDATHTPGPWTIREGDSVVRIEAGSESVAATDTKAYWQRHDKTDIANARLIAAAPDLLAALKVLLDEAEGFNVSGVYFSEECMGHKGPDLARAAIAKAEGRS